MSLAQSFSRAIDDLVSGFRMAPLWWRLSLEQTVTRYRRTVLGPFWLASTTLATAFSLAVVFGSIFGGNIRDSLPFIMAGVTAWSITGGMLAEAANTYVNGSGVMQVQKLPISFYAFLQVCRAMVNFFHQLVGLWLVLVVMRLAVVPHWELLLALPLIMLISVFICIPLGMLSVRFRDINYMVGFVAQALFMLTPVFWRRAQVSEKMRWVVDLNPFAHLMEILRQPLLGHPAPLADWLASLGLLGGCVVLTVIALTFFRRRVVFWL